MAWVALTGILWILVRVEQIARKQVKIMANLDKIESEVSGLETVVDSAVKLIDSLSQEIKNAGTDQGKLDALVARLDAKKDALAAAVAANTAAAEETPAEPAPAPEA